MQRLVLDQPETASRKDRALTMDSPGYVDVEYCKNEDDGAEDWCDNVLESWEPVGHLLGDLLGGKSGVCLGAVVGLDVGRGG